MSNGNREKASDIFNNSTPLLGKKVSFAEAFPSIKNIKIVVKYSGDEVSEYNNERTFDKSVGEYIDCLNSICRGGGFHIANIIRKMVAANETTCSEFQKCKGNETSPHGKVIYRSCYNYFDVKIDIEYKQADNDKGKLT